MLLLLPLLLPLLLLLLHAGGGWLVLSLPPEVLGCLGCMAGGGEGG